MDTFNVQKRDMAVKAKKLRSEGFVTGNLFGRKIENSIPLVIEGKEAERIRATCVKGSQILLNLDGQTYDVLIKEMDYDSMKHQMLEIDFQALVKGEKVHSVAEVILLNKEKVVDGTLEQTLEEVAYKALPEHVFDKIEIDCTKLRLGDEIYVKDLEVAGDKNIEITTHGDTMVVKVAPFNKAVEEATADAADTTDTKDGKKK